MKIKTVLCGPLKWGRHCLGALRSLSPAAMVAATLALVFGGVGVAGAATGGNFILGKANSETTLASLNNSNGTPLKLIAPSNAAPLKVSNSNLVSGLNSQFVGGLSASQLATGGDGFTQPTTDTSLEQTAVEVASTGALAAGTYYVNATALLNVASGDSFGFCYIARGSDTAAVSYGGATQQQGWLQAAETAAVSIVSGDTLQEWCYSGGTNGSFAYDTGITAIRVLSSSGTAPASGVRSGVPAPGALPGKGR
jgi:hypothetical protein